VARRLAPRIAAIAGAALLFGVLAVIANAWYDSRLPGTYSVMDYGTVDLGGGPPASAHGSATHGATSVAMLRGPRTGTPDAHFSLTAREAEIRLASGKVVDALTFNGRSPGPELRVKQGDLVEVNLANEDVATGVTIHWHGVDVPNAEDGVAGVTQDAVLAGERYTYRFRARQQGTFWYHTHQLSDPEVRRGLFGAFVIEPAKGIAEDTLDLAVVAHTFAGVPTLNGRDDPEQRALKKGTFVRLRLVNSDNAPHRFTLTGTPVRVLAIDGTDLNGPSELEGASVEVAAGGRTDLGFTMPATPVGLSLERTNLGLTFSEDGSVNVPPAEPGPDFDPLTYGTPAKTPFDSSAPFDRRFELKIGKKPGFLDGRPGMQWTLNGKIYPSTPVFVVGEGDRVEATIENDSGGVHPMHLHGHHMLVLSRDGVQATGSPWWVDTLNVSDGERYVLAFRANNPGIWMGHCHNLAHAAQGLTMHVAYSGVTTPFRVGDTPGNDPE